MGTTHFSGPVDSKLGFAVNGTSVISPDRYLYVAKGSVAYNGGASQVVAKVPAGCIVLDVILNITTAFAGTSVTIDVGDASDTDRFIANADVTENAVGFTRSSKTSAAGAAGHVYSSDTNIVASVGGTSLSAGAATVYVLYAKIA